MLLLFLRISASSAVRGFGCGYVALWKLLFAPDFGKNKVTLVTDKSRAFGAK